jgi:hypothetical protein
VEIRTCGRGFEGRGGTKTRSENEVKGDVVARVVSPPDCCPKVSGLNPASPQPAADCHL